MSAPDDGPAPMCPACGWALIDEGPGPMPDDISAAHGAALTIRGEHLEWSLELSGPVAAAMRDRPAMRRRIDAIMDVALAEVTQVVSDLLDGGDSEEDCS